MTKNDKRTLIAKIHIAKKDLAMDDATYRDVLVRVTGKNSCKDMSLSELKAVIKDLKRLGFTVKQTTKPKHGRKPTTTPEREAMLSKIGAMLADMGLHWHYAHGMAKKMFGVDMVHWLDAEKMYKVVQALAVYQKRHATEVKQG
ncbi:MAG: regulatory protein GemA [Moraxella sp.]|nr:regulatory protein GemA [Moraxella sp.]